ncbi:hypothetical protein WR25_07337 [Diploscapter pachys]|uniref:SXP/RAL-2 family protein Ani s 5-like cation-binding domain-containing protein n=1 Tax=Diploscapter pachys TaxID=2018661 RepID=A0A2A2KBE5_9BILA|nr:hypothetical protein WR25_07337 [Diploscapter pachys]
MKLVLLIVGALLAVSISARPAENTNSEIVDRVEKPTDEDKSRTEEQPREVLGKSSENPEKTPENENLQEKPSKSKAKKPLRIDKLQDEVSALLDFDVEVDDKLQAMFIQLFLNPEKTAQQKLDEFIKASGDRKYDEEERDILLMFFEIFDQLKDAWVKTISQGLNDQAMGFFDKVWEGIQESAKTGSSNPPEEFIKDMQEMGDKLTPESMGQIMTAFEAFVKTAKKALASGQRRLFEKYGDKDEDD